MILYVEWHRLGLAIVPLCRGTGAPPPFDEHRRPLASSKFFDVFDVCVTEKNSIIAVAP